MRLILLFGSLCLALALAVLTLQTPRPVGARAAATQFSAARAMTDVREIARYPHPVGSADHQRVLGYLAGRMAALGLGPVVQVGSLSPDALRRIADQGGDPDAVFQAQNLFGILPGRDPDAPAVLLMAHYDTVPGSPGAADDTTGVAAVLEAVRAIQARGPVERPLVVLFTDGEELNLDGARLFFSENPLRDRIGAVVNLEARGGGGRAMMFETGQSNAVTIRRFSRVARTATGGVTSNSLAALVYGLMPNATDFTISRNRGLPGVNLAFIGRAAQYHSPTATPAALDQGSLQHIGAQALESADAFLRAPSLSEGGETEVYADLFGLVLAHHSPQTGWLLLSLAVGLSLLAGWGAVRNGARLADVGRGALAGVEFVSVGVVAAQAVRVLAGPTTSRIASAETYYTLLRRLPWIEAGAGFAVLAVALLALGGAVAVSRTLRIALIVLALVVATAFGGFSPLTLIAGVLALGLGLSPQVRPLTAWGGWLGLISLVLALGLIVQIAAPTAAFLFIWTGLLAALSATAVALIGASLTRPQALIPAAVAVVLGGAWIVGLAHPTFLGVGMDLPGVFAVLGLFVLMFARPLAPSERFARPMAVAAAVCLVLACGLSLSARWAEPAPPPSSVASL